MQRYPIVLRLCLFFKLFALYFCISLAGLIPHATARPLRMIVPFAAGGPIDVTTRILVQSVGEALGGPIIVENRPGAGGNIGMEALARANPDGMTLGIATTASHALNPWLFSKLPYDPTKDFTPISQMLRVPNVLVIPASFSTRLKIDSVVDLVLYGKNHSEKLSFGSGGNGSAGHLAGELLKSLAGFTAVHVPYNGAAPAQIALLSGQVDFNIDNLASAASNISSGKLKALAVTTAVRSPLLPQIAALAETYPGFAIDTWWGVVAPSGTAPEKIKSIHNALTKSLHSAEVTTHFAALMAEPAPSSPEAFAQFIELERVKYQKMVKLSGAKVD